MTAAAKIKKNKVHIFGDSTAVKGMFKARGFEIVESNNPKDFEIAVLTGGADICPFLYGEREIVGTSYDPDRDMAEVAFLKSLPSMMPKLGICRGGQLMNVIIGNGRMIQDTDKHRAGKHNVVFDGFRQGDVQRNFLINSYHHQLMIPGEDATVVGRSYESTLRKTPKGVTKISRPSTDEYDAEIIYYWQGNALCFQAHPEYEGDKDNPTRELFFECVDYVLL